MKVLFILFCFFFLCSFDLLSLTKTTETAATTAATPATTPQTVHPGCPFRMLQHRPPLLLLLLLRCCIWLFLLLAAAAAATDAADAAAAAAAAAAAGGIPLEGLAPGDRPQERLPIPVTPQVPPNPTHLSQQQSAAPPAAAPPPPAAAFSVQQADTDGEASVGEAAAAAAATAATATAVSFRGAPEGDQSVSPAAAATAAAAPAAPAAAASAAAAAAEPVQALPILKVVAFAEEVPQVVRAGESVHAVLHVKSKDGALLTSFDEALYFSFFSLEESTKNTATPQEIDRTFFTGATVANAHKGEPR